MLSEIAILKNFSKLLRKTFTTKNSFWKFTGNNFTTLQNCTLIAVFSWEFWGNFQEIYFSEHLFQRIPLEGCFCSSDSASLNRKVLTESNAHRCSTEKSLCGIIFSRTRSLVVSELLSEIKVYRFESGCLLCAEVSSLQYSPG